MKDVTETKSLDLGEEQGNVLLLVNVASFWGITYQYLGLNALVTKFAGRKFDIIGVPCNQFGLVSYTCMLRMLYPCDEIQFLDISIYILTMNKYVAIITFI